MSTDASTARRGIIAGGNWIVDRVKLVDRWPEEEGLANILEQTTANGGAAYNVLIDLAKLGANIPLQGIGLVGKDADGEHILRDCREHGIETRLLGQTGNAPTSYTDVITVRDTGRRTFFHQRGANALLGPEHFDFARTRAKLFHLGYLLLLDRLDELDPEFGTMAGRVLEMARDAGLKTSLDVVSESAEHFQSGVQATLRHVDVCLMNEIEAERTTGIAVRVDHALERSKMHRAAEALIACGVGEWAIIHAEEGAFALHARGEAIWKGAVNVPPSDVRGAVGAGDAFAAGVLLALHEGLSMEACLVQGHCVAASCLLDSTASGGVRPLSDCLEAGRNLGFRCR